MNTTGYWRRPRVQRAAVLSLTTFFWMIWLYLIMPLLSLLMWLAGYQLFVEEMVVLGGYEALLGELRHYGLTVLAILLGILLWIDWNQRRYGRHNQRTVQPSPVTVAEQAEHAGLTPETLTTLRTARRTVVDFDEQDRLRMRG